MLDMHAVISRMLVILILLCIGFAAKKAKYMDAVSDQKLSRIVINVAVCGLVLGSVMNLEPSFTKAQALYTLGISFLLMLVFVGVGYLTPILLRAGREERGTYIFMSTFGNVGFMGMPVIASILGSEAVFLAALYNIPFNFLMYSIGCSMISGGKEKLRFSLRSVLNPAVLSSVAAFLIFLLDIRVPQPVAESAVILGNMVLPASMLILGSSLGGISVKELFSGLRLYGLLVIKLLVYPVLTWAILRIITTNQIILGTLTAVGAMPVASSTTMLSIEYGGNEQLATRGVVLSTFLSVATIPLIVYLLLA